MSKRSGGKNSLRKAAERQRANASVAIVGAAEELLHELQVHQIELEAQNEALRQQQLALEESRDRYQDLYDFAPVGYLTLSAAGLIVEINVTGARLLGHEPNNLLQKYFVAFVASDDQDRWTRYFRSAVHRGQNDAAELGLRREDGCVFLARLDCALKKVGAGETAIRVTVTDITEAKLHETDLRVSEQRYRDSEERYRLIFEMSEDAIFLTHPDDGRTLATNPAASKMFGYSETELCDLGRDGIMDRSDARLWSLLAESRRSGHARGVTGSIRRNGESFPVEMTTSNFHDSNGRPLAIIQLRDITEQKRAKKALRESEIRWQFAVESHGDAMWDWDADQDELFLTDAARELFGLPDTGSKRPIADLIGRLLDQDREPMQGQLDALIAGKTSEWQGEYRFSTDTAAPRWIGMRGRVMMRTSNGQPHRIVSISRDITKQKLKEAEDRRQTKLFAHQGRLVIIGELASALAHEINQPLTAIAGFAAVCARKVPDVPEALKLLHIIEEQAIRAGEIGWRMRGFARRQTYGHEAVSLPEVIEGVSTWLRMDSTNRDLVIDIAGIGPELAQVDVSRVELEQVLVNLIRNGIEAYQMDAKQRLISIAGSPGEHPGTIEVTVADWGCGLPRDINFDVFLPFSSTKAEGLGLGLAISASIIEGHSGRLWATPNPEGGTIFHFTLPVAEPVAKEHVA